MQLSLVHCADLHIGAQFSYLPSDLAKIRRDELCYSLSDIVEFCKERSVDALLICGDLFDCPTPTKRDCEQVKSLLASLSPIPVYIACGNHDYMCSESPFFKEGYFSDNVHIFPGFDYSFEIPHKNAVIHGKSFSRSTTEPSFGNLSLDQSKINIMCLHGDILPGSDYNIISKETLSETGCEYAAFGHIHNGEVFYAGNVKCAYCGTAEPHKFNDDGNTGFIYAQITKDETSISNIAVSKRHYHNIELDISGSDESDIISDLKSKINKTDLFQIYLKGEKYEGCDINLPYIKEQLSDFAFYIELRDNTTVCYDFDSIEAENSLRGEFLRELREICSGEEDFIISAKMGLDALSGHSSTVEVDYAD